MTTSYTTLLGLALPVPGELDGTWGDVVNNSITQLVEDSIANSATADVTASDWTLTTTGSGAANQARMAVLIPTGTPGVSRNIIAPSHNKAYIVINQSNAAVVVKGAATTGTPIAAGQRTIVVWNGSDFIEIAPTNATNATNATNLLSGTAGSIPYQTGAGATSFTAAGSTGQVLSSTGTGAPVWANPQGLSLLATVTPANGVTSASVTGLSSSKNIVVITDGLVTSGTGGVGVALSSNNGSSYGSTNELTNANNTTPNGYVSFYRCDVSSSKPFITILGVSGITYGYTYTSTTGIINAIRFTVSSTFTGVGSIYIYGAN
jgi:hypothetical protein